MAVGALSLLAGREGLGKSTLAYWIAARLSRGELPGEYFGQPKAVFVCATEDSWACTIGPRLRAAGADLGRVYRLDVEDDGLPSVLSLPADVGRVAGAARDLGAALLILDPLLSRLSRSLDTHKDSEVRQALEPLTRMADEAALGVLGLIHLNKAGGSDPMNSVMGSRAFSAVARSVSVVVPDPDDDDRRLFGTPKNNLGPVLPLLPYAVEGCAIESPDGPVQTGRVRWSGTPVAGTISDAMARAAEQPRRRTRTTDVVGEWLEDLLASHGGELPRSEVVSAAADRGYSENVLKRALRDRESLGFRSAGMPRRTFWFVRQDEAA